MRLFSVAGMMARTVGADIIKGALRPKERIDCTCVALEKNRA